MSIPFKISVSVILAGIIGVVMFAFTDYFYFSQKAYSLFILSFFVFLFLFSIATSYVFVRPLRKLLELVRGADKGTLKEDFYFKSKNEFGKIETAFRKMAKDLREARTLPESVRKSLNQEFSQKSKGFKDIILALEQKVKNRTFEMQRALDASKLLKEKVYFLESKISKLKSLPKKKTVKKFPKKKVKSKKKK